jgi:CBS domain-containing protein
MSVTVAHLLTSKGRDVVTVSRSDTLRDATALLGRHNIGALVVTEDGAVIGVLSERDIVRVMSTKGPECFDLAVAEAMTSDVFTCGEDESTDQLMSLMTERRIRHVPVVREGRLAGIISIGDVVKSRVDELEVAKSSLEDYVTGSSY